jgi:hypothetical protein
MNAQHEAEQLKAKLERLRDTWPEQTCQSLLTCVDIASVANHNGMIMSRAVVVALRQIRELGELTVRTRYHGTAEWRASDRDTPALRYLSGKPFWTPMYMHAIKAKLAVHEPIECRIHLELFIAATIETYRRLNPGRELVDYALEMCS